MIYFDNAATTLPKPPSVIVAAADAAGSMGNPARGAHALSLNSLRCMLSTRMALASLFGMADPMRAVFTLNATAALNIAIGGVDGHIVTTAAEHNSVLRPLFRRGNFSVAPCDKLGRVNVKDIFALVNKDTRAVVMCHASNVTGNVFDIAEVGFECKKRGLLFIVDAAQTAGLLPIDMQGMNISALAVSGHKSLYGVQGVGALCLSEDFSPPPLVVGGSGSDSFSTAHPVKMPDALEAGTQNMMGIAALNAGISYVVSQNGACFSDADRLSRMFIAGASGIKRVRLIGDMDGQRTPVVSLTVDGMDCGYIAAELFDRYGIAVRAGAHCAPLMHEALTNKQGAVRFSFSHFNTQSEVQVALDALDTLIKESL